MCLILFAYQTHPKYPLILVANRDEFYERPTSQVGWWIDKPNILAGRDLKGGGTWLGMNNQGEFAALTNFRDPQNFRTDAPSRGALVTDFLTKDISPQNYSQDLHKENKNYNGYNLLTYSFKESQLAYYSNEDTGPKVLSAGLYGLCNHVLDTPWPKVEHGKMGLDTLIREEDIQVDDLFALMQYSHVAPDDLLPSTGVPLELERALSPMFIRTPNYGTRCSSVVLVDNEGNVFFEERSYVPKGEAVSYELPASNIKK